MRFLRCNALSRCNAYTGRALGALVSKDCLEHVASAVRRHDRTTEVELFEDEAVGPPELTRNTLTEYPHSSRTQLQFPHAMPSQSTLTQCPHTQRPHRTQHRAHSNVRGDSCRSDCACGSMGFGSSLAAASMIGKLQGPNPGCPSLLLALPLSLPLSLLLSLPPPPLLLTFPTLDPSHAQGTLRHQRAQQLLCARHPGLQIVPLALDRSQVAAALLV